MQKLCILYSSQEPSTKSHGMVFKIQIGGPNQSGSTPSEAESLEMEQRNPYFEGKNKTPVWKLLTKNATVAFLRNHT